MLKLCSTDGGALPSRGGAFAPDTDIVIDIGPTPGAPVVMDGKRMTLRQAAAWCDVMAEDELVGPPRPARAAPVLRVV